MMVTIQVTIDRPLLYTINQVIKKHHTTRSALIRDSLMAFLKQMEAFELEAKHREGYAKKPVKKGEFSDWEGEQVWGDE